ncbi:MAG: methyltransferase domain-containing protein [Gammaproteobacteria bacterium]|nr:methyltransferase domain-containing protein [Gammaproteobacteria bacterium]
MSAQTTPTVSDQLLSLLRCPQSGERLLVNGNGLASQSGKYHYKISADNIPLFADEFLSDEAAIQQEHYDQIADAYAANLEYPHTREYMAYLDRVLHESIGDRKFGTCAELCCGTGEAFALFEDDIPFGVGVDVSSSMLSKAQRSFDGDQLSFVQGDATRLPLAADAFDSVIMLGGIHHVPDRDALFAQVFRVLKPGGVFIFREPVSDFWLWKLLRGIIYRLSPMLDHETERPLTYQETVPVLERAGFVDMRWRTCGFLGFCLFMNSDVLFVNRAFRFIPGISAITRGFARFDDWCTRRSLLKKAGLQVVGIARKSTETNSHEQ